MATAENTQLITTSPMDMAINNKFIDQMTAQLTEKQKYGLTFPKDYNVTNALNSAYLMLRDVTVKKKKGNEWVEERALDICSKQSIASSLIDMAVQALNPMKKQCYFVPFGEKLTLMRSYQGTMAVAKRVGAKDIRAEVIYDGDVFEYHIENGYKVIDQHKQDFKNIDNDKITGAYAVVEYPGFTPYVEIMNMAQIKKSWAKNRKADLSKPEDVHNEFADQMVKKTVINRACKNFINSSDDAYLTEAFDNTRDSGDNVDVVAETVTYDVETHANSKSFPSPQEIMEGTNESTVDQVPPSEPSQEDVVAAGKTEDDVPDFMK